jgi:hypothetical protein
MHKIVPCIDFSIRVKRPNHAADRPTIPEWIHTWAEKRKQAGKPLEYYDLKTHWTKRIMPHLRNEELNGILKRDFAKFIKPCPFVYGMLPRDFDRGSWRARYDGSIPRYWAYVCSKACHWIVNFALKLAMLAEPDVLFDFNYQAMGMDPLGCFTKAWFNGYELPPGRHVEVGDPLSTEEAS